MCTNEMSLEKEPKIGYSLCVTARVFFLENLENLENFRIGTQFDAADVYKLPQGAKNLLRRKDSIKASRLNMEQLIKTYDEQRARIPPIFQPLMEGHIHEVQQKIKKGLIYICWNSLIQEKYFQGISEGLAKLKLKVIKYSFIE